jgi:hypothetical protein
MESDSNRKSERLQSCGKLSEINQTVRREVSGPGGHACNPLVDWTEPHKSENDVRKLDHEQSEVNRRLAKYIRECNPRVPGCSAANDVA